MTQEKGVAETRWLDVNGHEFEQTPTDSEWAGFNTKTL